MKSRNIVFPGAGRVEIREEDGGAARRRRGALPRRSRWSASAPKAIACAASTTPAPTGRSTSAIRSARATAWRPRSSPSATAVTRHKVGDRVTSWAPHCGVFRPAARISSLRYPTGIKDEEAIWATLARTTQIGGQAGRAGAGRDGGGGRPRHSRPARHAISRPAAAPAASSSSILSQKRLDLALPPTARRMRSALPVGRRRRTRWRASPSGKMADVVFDVTGHPAVLAPASLLLRKLGRLVLLGDTPTPSRQHLGPRIVGDSIAILGIHGMMYPDAATPFNQWTAEAMTALFFDFVQSRRMNVASLITHRVSPTRGRARSTIRSPRRPDAALGVYSIGPGCQLWLAGRLTWAAESLCPRWVSRGPADDQDFLHSVRRNAFRRRCRKRLDGHGERHPQRRAGHRGRMRRRLRLRDLPCLCRRSLDRRRSASRRRWKRTCSTSPMTCGPTRGCPARSRCATSSTGWSCSVPERQG